MSQITHKIQDFKSVKEFLNFYKMKSPSFLDEFDEILKKYCRSSYIRNGFGRLFSSLTYNYEFQNILELGVLDGYSLLSMANGQNNNQSTQKSVSIIGVDLFEEYEFNSGKKISVQNLIDEFLFQELITLIQSDVFSDKRIEDILRKSNLIHVDLGNDRIKVENIMSIIEKKKDFIIIFEGGSTSRDQVEWMIKYNKKSMRPYFEELSRTDKYLISTIEADPGLTIVSSKGFIF
jgi:hypothetical protein